MKVIWSAYSKRVHRFDGDASDERCNVDAIRSEDRRTAELDSDVRAWAKSQKLKVCNRCLSPGVRGHTGVRG